MARKRLNQTIKKSINPKGLLQKMAYHKVEGESHLVRDTESQAILNTDVEALKAFKKKREQDRAVARMLEEHNQMKSDIDDIKKMLQMLIDIKSE